MDEFVDTTGYYGPAAIELDAPGETVLYNARPFTGPITYAVADLAQTRVDGAVRTDDPAQTLTHGSTATFAVVGAFLQGDEVVTAYDLGVSSWTVDGDGIGHLVVAVPAAAPSGTRTVRFSRDGCSVGTFPVTVQSTDGELHPVAPARLLDTRSDGGGTPIGPGGVAHVPVTGRGGVPAAGVRAAVLNVTAVGATASTFLTVYPSGASRPLASNLNLEPGQVVPNLVFAGLGSDGTVDIYNLTGSTHVVVDVFGWFSDATGPDGARLVSASPQRLLDTRNGAPLDPRGSVTVSACAGSAALVNVTVTQPTEAGFLTVHATGSPLPLASNLNFVPGQTVPNLVVAPLDAQGRLDVYSSAGRSHVIVDLLGCFVVDGSGERFVPGSAPARAFDTRTAADGPALKGSRTIKLTGRGGVGSGTSTVVLNTTVTGSHSAGYLTVSPGGVPVPLASNLNWVANQTIANLVVVPVTYAPGQPITLTTNSETHVVGDVAGWFDSLDPGATPNRLGG